jgi:hypothetical protein
VLHTARSLTGLYPARLLAYRAVATVADPSLLLPVTTFGGPTHRRPTKMQKQINLITTGDVARVLFSTEPRIAETVRRGRVDPPPMIVAGRRLWTHAQVLSAAEALGTLDGGLRERIDAAFGIAPAGGDA